eukprot:1145521-Pelagomonas_calceolata.AAC.1
MKFASKFNGTLVVKSQLYELVKGMLSIKCSTNAQENGMKSHSFCAHVSGLHSVGEAVSQSQEKERKGFNP